MLKQLGAYPAYVGGNSAGQRASLLLAIRHPEAVLGLLLWNITGGSVAAEQLGFNYYEQFIEIAKEYDTLRLEDPGAFQEIGHDRRAPIFLNFLTSISKSN